MGRKLLIAESGIRSLRPIVFMIDFWRVQLGPLGPGSQGAGSKLHRKARSCGAFLGGIYCADLIYFDNMLTIYFTSNPDCPH